jgi:hypothetical protein
MLFLRFDKRQGSFCGQKPLERGPRKKALTFRGVKLEFFAFSLPKERYCRRLDGAVLLFS